MRTISAALLAAQKSDSATPYIRILLISAGGTGATTATYTTEDATNRIPA